jgi:basic membrane protein A and related proteins
MRKNPGSLAAVVAVLALALAACQGNSGGASGAATGSASASTAASASASTAASESAAPSESAAATDFKACQVSDTGGIDDKGFNQSAYAGLERAQEELGVEIAFLESTAATDYERNINTFIDEGCDLIITVGFLLGDATADASARNADQMFAIVDFAYDVSGESKESQAFLAATAERTGVSEEEVAENIGSNVQGLVFDTKSASMLAGYLAAGMSETATVGTFGGIAIGPVTDFMYGYEAGVNYYNDQNGTAVDVIGWDSTTGEGTFTGDFENQDNGRQTAEALIQEGADVIFPVAGPVGLGAMAAVQDSGGDALYIGVDVDQAISVPEYEDIMLSSVLKRIDNAVFAAIEDAMDGSFESGLYVGTLENEGVGLAPYHAFEDQVPQELTDGITALQEALVSGEVTADEWSGAPAP